MGFDSDFKPAVRPLEAFPFEQDGQHWVGLQDPTGFAPGQVAVSPVAFFIITHFDGRHTIAQVQEAFAQKFCEPVTVAQICQLIQQLDEAMLLESPRFAKKYQAQVKAFLDAPVRRIRDGTLPPRQQLDGLLRRMSQPVRAGNGPDGRARLVGLVAPHLDYPRGLPCYATAYGTLASCAAGGASPELVVVLGTNHFGAKMEPVGTDKAFETPFGEVASDRDALCQLNDSCGGDLLAGQYDHVREHSVELQVTVLARLLGAERFRMVGILLSDACDPACQVHMDNLARGLSKLAAQRDGSMLIVAGADLSHVGSHFGDQRPIEPDWMKDVAAADRAAIMHLQSARPEDFVEELRRTRNATRVCSSGSLYVLRRVLADTVWQDLGYHQAADAKTGTCVTCMAAALWRMGRRNNELCPQ